MFQASSLAHTPWFFWGQFQFLCYRRGFNDAISGFNDDGWSLVESDGMDDVVLTANSTKRFTTCSSSDNAFTSAGGVICAKASMLLKVSSILVNFQFILDDLKGLISFFEF